jgi:hypothetical protein
METDLLQIQSIQLSPDRITPGQNNTLTVTTYVSGTIEVGFNKIPHRAWDMRTQLLLGNLGRRIRANDGQARAHQNIAENFRHVRSGS